MTTATSPKKGTVYLEKSSAIAHIYLSNPGRYNAMSLSMWHELEKVVHRAQHDPEVRVLLLQGEGDKAFVSGADISEFGASRGTPEQAADYAAAVHAAQYALSSCPKPVIAGIQGICMGGGLGLILACDLRYSTDNSRFRMPAARLGLGYDVAGLQRMVDVIGAARATDLFFTARTFNGSEAARIDLVHQSFAPEDFGPALREICEAVAHNAPLTLHAAKLSLRHILNDPNAQDAAQVAQAIQACFDSQDYQEGQRAFAEKRLPQFTGK